MGAYGPSKGKQYLMTAIGTIERLPKSKARIWVKCPECVEERWAPYTKHQFFYTQRHCRECNTNKKRKFNINPFPKNEDKPMRHVLR
jgi:hypothetical protein